MKLRIGYWNKSCKDPLYYGGPSHGAIIGPARSSKFASILVPMLLTAEHSTFVLDPKAEAACVTGAYRRDVLKQRVILLNPFKVYPRHLGGFEHGQFDPIGTTLDPNSETFAADANCLAEGWLPIQATSATGSTALASSWPVWRCI